MSDDSRRLSRRAALQLAGGVAAGATIATKAADALPERANADTDEETTPSAAASFVVPAEAIPDRFNRLESPELPPLVEHLGTVSDQYYDAESAIRGYWYGNTRDDPRWVISSLALVCENPVPSEDIEQAASEFHAEYVDEYDAETPPSVSVTRATNPCHLGTDYRTTLTWSEPHERAGESDREYMLADTFRLKIVGEVVLGTVVSKFGASAEDIDPLLTRLSDLQQQRFRQHFHRIGT